MDSCQYAVYVAYRDHRYERVHPFNNIHPFSVDSDEQFKEPQTPQSALPFVAIQRLMANAK